MKIAFLSRYQNMMERGAENFVAQFSKRLSKNHEVNIFSDKNADNLGEVIKGNYDIVIPINGRMQSLKASLGRLSSKYKLLITGHSGPGRDDIWNIAVCRPDVFVALTDYARKWAQKWAFGIKTVKISNGVDIDKFSPNGAKIDINLPRPVVLSAAALIDQKQHEKAIKAVAKSGGASLLITGEGPLKEELNKMGKALLGERFMIESFTFEEMPKVYRSCDLFTLPSWDREAFGMVYLEAMASGLGLVVPDDESRREIAGDAALFFNPDSLGDYAAKIKQALTCDWTKKARLQAEKFSWQKIAEEYERVMSDMMKDI